MPPAARIGDQHICPMVSGTTPHTGGPVAAGLPTVLIGNAPAARAGDMATCVGPPDSILMGSATVLIGNQPAARLGDSTVHGGTLSVGCPTVIIGDVYTGVALAAPASSGPGTADPGTSAKGGGEAASGPGSSSAGSGDGGNQAGFGTGTQEGTTSSSGSTTTSAEFLARTLRGTKIPKGNHAVPCIIGNLEITVNKAALCWDTGPEGLKAQDQPLEAVTVTLSRSGLPAPPSQMTDSEGKVTFKGILIGDWQIDASKTGFDSPAPVTATVTCNETASATTTLTRQGLECDRKHPKVEEGKSGGGSIWSPVFWLFSGEPWPLYTRDGFWLTSGVTAAGVALSGNVALAATFAAIFAYFSAVIFGAVPGSILMGLAFGLFGAVMASMFVPSIGAFLGLSGPDPFSLAMLVATWAGFSFALALGRRPTFSRKQVKPTFSVKNAFIPYLAGGVGAAAVLMTLLLFPQSLGIGWGSVAVGVGTLFASLAGFFAHVFMNDGQTKAQHWSQGSYLLPYEGERYCVQGLRGFISHFEHEEYCYDWAIPEGKPVLCAREGHIINYREDRDGTQFGDGNSIANHVYVQHRDGSIAEYLHGKKGGVTSINPKLATESKNDPAYPGAREVDKPVYVQAGQVLCEAGNVGISMFPHIHFTVRRGPSDPSNGGDAAKFHPVKFQDDDAARHDGVCFSMRKYRSSNKNRGPVIIP